MKLVDNTKPPTQDPAASKRVSKLALRIGVITWAVIGWGIIFLISYAWHMGKAAAS